VQLTLFTHPKPFLGTSATLQRNALRTWTALPGTVDVLVFGDEEGVQETAVELGCRALGPVASAENGAPRVDDLFSRAQAAASGPHVCFVNGDILLPPSLTAALDGVWAQLPTAVCLGRCRNLLVERELPGWTEELEQEARTRSTPRPPGGIDYLAFARGTFEAMPPFALGRAGVDNWLVWDARRRGLPVVDLSEVVLAVHQDHEYGHLAGGRIAAYEGPDAQRNLALAGGELHLFNIDDATHRLTAAGLRLNRLAPLRAFPPARWAALRWGEAERALRRLLRRAAS
jgi:hypothetical protein